MFLEGKEGEHQTEINATLNWLSESHNLRDYLIWRIIMSDHYLNKQVTFQGYLSLVTIESFHFIFPHQLLVKNDKSKNRTIK